MDLSELFEAIIKDVEKKNLFFGRYRYRVIEQIGDLVNLQTVGFVEGLKDMTRVPKAHGLGGAKETLTPSTLVLVGFEGGNPGAPYVAQYLPDQLAPVSTSLEAKIEFNITVTDGDFNVEAGDTANIIPETAAYIGGDEMLPAAVGPLVDDRLATLLAAVNAIAVVVGVPTTPPLGSVGSDKVYITTGSGKPYDPHEG